MKIVDFNFPIPDDNNSEIEVEEIYFYNLFVNDTLFDDMAMHTNLYYQFLAANVGKIKPSSRANKFTAVSGDKMKVIYCLDILYGYSEKAKHPDILVD